MKDVVQQMNLDSPRASRTRSSASVSPTKSHVSTPKTAQRYSGTTPASKRGRKSQTTTPQPSPTKPKARTTATSQKARDGEGGGRLELMNPHASRSTTRRETEMDAMHARQEEEESPTRNAYGLKQSAKSPFLSPLPPVAGSSKDVISPAGQQSAETPTRRGTRSDPRAQAQLGSSAVAVTPTKRGRGAPRTPLRAVDVVDADQAAEEAAQREADREVLEQADEDERQARSKARRRVLWDFELDDQVREWMDVNEEEEKAWRADMREQLLVLLAEHDE